MNKEIPDAAIVGIILAVVAALGFFIYRSTEPAPVTRVDPKVMRDRMMQARGSMGGGARPPQAGRARMMPPGGTGQQRPPYQPPQTPPQSQPPQPR